MKWLRNGATQVAMNHSLSNFKKRNQLRTEKKLSVLVLINGYLGVAFQISLCVGFILQLYFLHAFETRLINFVLNFFTFFEKFSNIFSFILSVKDFKKFLYKNCIYKQNNIIVLFFKFTTCDCKISAAYTRRLDYGRLLLCNDRLYNTNLDHRRTMSNTDHLYRNLTDLEPEHPLA